MDVHHKEIQETEIEAVKAIFGDDFEAVETKTVWKTVAPDLEFKLRIRPTEEHLQNSVGLKLGFKLPRTYPKSLPTFSLEETRGLSNAQISALEGLLRTKAKELLNSEMIYELACLTADRIKEVHQSVRFGKQHSLKDEMALRTEKAVQEEALRAAAEEEERRKQLEAEDAKLAHMLELESQKEGYMKLQREKRNPGVRTYGDIDEADCDKFIERLESPLVNLDGVSRVQIIQLGVSVEKATLGTIYSAGLLDDNDRPLGKAATAHVTDICSPYFMSPQGERKIQRVQDQVQDLSKLKHPNLQTVLGVHRRYCVDEKGHEGWRLVVISEPLTNTLEDLLACCEVVSSSRAIEYVQQLAFGLEYLHARGIVHCSIQPRHILIKRDDQDKSTVKLARVCWYQLLLDINRSNSFTEVQSTRASNPGWLYPGAHQEPLRYNEARDVWDLGVTMAQMLFGLDVVRRFHTPADLLRSYPGSKETKPLLGVLAELLSPKPRLSSVARLANPLTNGMHTNGTSSNSSLSPARKISTPLPEDAIPGGPLSPNSLLTPSQDQNGFFWQPRAAPVSVSRYRSDFEELEFLGRGAFGQVVKARNKVDGHIYAVKRIKLPTDKLEEDKILREVTIWSRMSHPNIVRYHTSWVETEIEGGEAQTESSLGSSDLGASGHSSESAVENSGESSSSGVIENETEFSLGLDDLDFLSKGHHSKSRNFPKIHFGNEDANSREPSNDSSDDSSDDASERSAITSKTVMPPRRTLYIQMEFVENLTLREAIDNGLSDEDAWRYFRQILYAMEHFTSISIVHRDLKPANIFIGANNNIRLGDFGLAVHHARIDASGPTPRVGHFGPESDLTSGIGTSLYRAPEREILDRQGKTDRTVTSIEKIDIYSLGIIAAELWYPMKTNSERVQVLKNLRKPSIELPPGWPAKHMPNQTRIIQWCLAHDPKLRASPQDLLRSNLIPSSVESDSFKELLRVVSIPDTPQSRSILDALFDQDESLRRRRDYRFDSINPADDSNDEVFPTALRDNLSEMFRVRGAVEMRTPLLAPAPPNKVHSATAQPYTLLDKDGTVLELSYDLNYAFCRMVARDDNLTRMKRWTMQEVYRHTGAIGGAPRPVLAANFDIVSPYRTLAAEAETIQLVDTILDRCAADSSDLVHAVNHSAIIDAVLVKVGARSPETRRAAIACLEAFSRDPSKTWSEFNSHMSRITGSTRAQIDELRVLDVRDDPQTAMTAVRAILSPVSAESVDKAFGDISELLGLAGSIGIRRRIVFAPLLCFEHDSHDGIFFQTCRLHGKKGVVAAGGRKDALVRRLALPGARISPPHVVGVSIAVNWLLSAKFAASERTRGEVMERRCDVYVVSHSAGLVRERLEVVKDLWAAGISADLMYDHDWTSMNPDQIANTCKREGIPFIIVVKQRGSQREVLLRVRSLLGSGRDAEVSQAEVADWITEELQHHRAVNVAAKGGSKSSINTLVPSDPIDCKLILPAEVTRKTKVKQKQLMIEKAFTSVVEDAAKAEQCPVFIVDVEGAAFQRMAESPLWSTSSEELRRIADLLPPSKKSYISEVQAAIQKHKDTNPNCRFFWIHSLREGKSAIMTYL